MCNKKRKLIALREKKCLGLWFFHVNKWLTVTLSLLCTYPRNRTGLLVKTHLSAETPFILTVSPAVIGDVIGDVSGLWAIAETMKTVHSCGDEVSHDYYVAFLSGSRNVERSWWTNFISCRENLGFHLAPLINDVTGAVETFQFQELLFLSLATDNSNPWKMVHVSFMNHGRESKRKREKERKIGYI